MGCIASGIRDFLCSNLIFAFSQIFIYFLFIYFFVPGSDLDSFPVDVAFMSSIRKRISLAKQIDKEEHM